MYCWVLTVLSFSIALKDQEFVLFVSPLGRCSAPELMQAFWPAKQRQHQCCCNTDISWMIAANLSTHSSEESLKDQVLISVRAFIDSHTAQKRFQILQGQSFSFHSLGYQSRCCTKVTCFILIIFTAEIRTCNLEQCAVARRSSLCSALCAQPQ